MPSQKNRAEREIRETLETDGWTVYSKGWPDYLAVRGDEVQFIEVKPAGESQLSSAQQVVFDILLRLGLKVRVVRATTKGVDFARKAPTVYFTRLGNGRWGVRGPIHIVIPGNRLYVARKGEEPRPVRIGPIQWAGKRVVIALFTNED